MLPADQVGRVADEGTADVARAAVSGGSRLAAARATQPSDFVGVGGAGAAANSP